MTRNDLSNIRFGFLHRWDSSNNSNNWIHVQTIYINRKITIMWRQRALFSFLVFLQFCTWSTEKDEENSWRVSLQNNKDENKWWPQLYKGLQAGNRWKANIQLLLGEFVKGQTIGEHLLQIQETPVSNCTCIAGSPYQKEDSLYDEDDYDGEDAAGQLQNMSMLSLRDL